LLNKVICYFKGSSNKELIHTRLDPELLRKEDGEIPKAALLWNLQGNRKRGRPRNSWRISVIKGAGRSWN